LGVTRKRDARSRAISAMRVSVLRAPAAPRAASSARSATSPSARRAALVAPRASADPIMIVSDLDGTMVGDDAATAAFTAAWTEEGAFPPGSALVYSTGRSLESFAALIAEKKDVMAVPDALICAVGTKVYKRVDDSNAAKDKTESLVAATLKKLLFKDAKEKEKADAAIERELRLWIEDIDWTARLDADWDADVIRAAAASAIKIAGDENAHMRPEEEFTEHKITLGVRDEHVESVMFEIERFCEAFSEDTSGEVPHGSEMSVGGSNAAGATIANETKRPLKKKRVIPKLVASGTGGWQYVDVVSRRAGKLESLEYVRNAFNVPTSRTVACGDSGNDILMLGGKNKAVVVGNAQPALLRWAEETLLTETDQNRLFLASEKEALGVLEGLRKFGLMAEK
jgi:hydroxymethylpyrimidine pyrophosphatase-like HAD family hydrolase